MTAASALLLAGCSTTTRGSGTEAEPAGVAETSSSTPDFGSSATPSSGGAVAGAKTTAQLQDGLLAAADLGTGWVANPDDSDDDDDDSGDDSADDCGSDVDLPKANRATIELDNDDPIESFSEEIGSAATASAAQADYTALLAAFKACSGQKDADGSVLTLTPATDFPKLGDNSTGFTTAATIAGISVAGSLAVVRDGRLIEFYISFHQAGSPTSGFVGYATAGVAKAHSLR